MNKILSAISAVLLLYLVGCSGKGVSSDSSPDTEKIPISLTLVYDSESMDEGYAHAAEKYFNALINGDFPAYMETLFPYFAEKSEEYMRSEHNYGIETSFENLRQNLVIENGSFTTLSLQYAEEQTVDAYLERLETLFGDDFAEECAGKFEEGRSLLFTLNARYDGYSEDFSVISEYEMICVKSGGNYYVFG